MKMKKISLLLAALMFLFLFSGCSEKSEAPKNENTVYAEVNGEKIMTDELDYFRTRCRAEVINEYAEKYGVDDFSDFWDKKFDGKTPSETLDEKALSQAVDAKIRLVLMRDNGVYGDISFSALREKAEKYNQEHENMQGNVGLNSIDLGSFYTYYVSTGEMELKNILAEGELKPTEDELSAMAEKNPNLTENGLISAVTEEKYNKLVNEKIENADVKICG